MKKIFLITIISCVFLLQATGQEAHFTIHPTLSPDGSTIIFSYEGDLWKVASAGGEAVRLTAMDGDETLPSISPDGQWLAFSSTQYGNKDVYVMPLAGGPIKQLTFHDASDDVDSWSWDSNTIYFTSGRYNRYSGYAVKVQGGTPNRLFQHYFNNVHNVAEHPDGRIFFNESWESKNFANRKRYKGDYNPDIKSYHPKTREYKTYTSYRGKDFWATIDKSGNIFFASDEGNDEYNLCTFKNDKKTSLTSFKTSIKRPHISANGQKVVFEKDYQIFVYDVARGKAEKVEIRMFTNNTLGKTQDFQVGGRISNFAVSPDNKKMAFVSRGELFVSDIKGKFVKQIMTLADERVREILWLKDNRTLLYTQTVDGYANLFTISADGKGIEKQLTSDQSNNVNITFDSKNEQAVYISGRDKMYLMDLEDFSRELIVEDEFWALSAPQPYFSPDDQYILYNAYRDFETDIFVYHIPTKKATNLTNTGVTEGNPFWSPDGKYIYFSSNPTQPSYPFGLQEPNIYRMALDKYEQPYKADKFDEIFAEEKKKDEDDKDKEGDDKEEKKKAEKDNEDKVSVSINTDGIMDRIQRIGPVFGSQRSPYIIQKDDKTYVLYASNHDEGSSKLWKTTLEPFEKDETKSFGSSRVFGYQIVESKGKHYILLSGSIHTLNVAGGSTKKIEISHKFRRNLSNEFNQMFYEAWAGFEENFYDENFHGEDWQALRDQYAAYLPHITQRSHLRVLFNDMLGELNTSHFGFSSFGKEENEYYGTRSLSTGILFSEEDPYQVKRIISDGPADVKGKDIKAGDKLVAVNGQEVDPTQNREMYFTQPSLDQELRLTIEREGQRHTINIHPISSFQQRSLMYEEWEKHNQEYVDKASNNRIAYVHMRNMGGGELNNFKRKMVSEGYQREAVILDLRNNTGGNVHDQVLQFLSQKPYLQWKYREGKLANQPNFGPASKPIIILTNEQTLSDAEMTSAGFKELGLGKIIGTETYRWIIFTSGRGLVDGSFYRLPSWGCYTLDGKDLEKEGVSPDIYVKETFKDRLDNQQPQLDRAIEEIMKELEK